jgi:hypothetical protein
VSAPHAGIDPAAGVPTPAPVPVRDAPSQPHRAAVGQSGVRRPSGIFAGQPHVADGGAAAAAAVLAPVEPASLPSQPFSNGESDAMNALNLSSAWTAPAGAPAPLQASGSSSVSSLSPVSSSVEAVAGAVQGQKRNLKLVSALLAVVAVCVFLLVSRVVVKKPAVVAPEKPAAAAVAPLPAEPARAPAEAPPAAAEAPPAAAAAAKPEAIARVGGDHAPAAMKKAPPRTVGARKPLVAAVAAADPVAPPPTAEQAAAAARFGDTSSRPVSVRTPGGSSASSRPPPSQADIARVISNNRGGIKICYQRALTRDSTLTNGKINVHISVGLSGRVKSVDIDAPTPFHVMDTCIKDNLGHWVFPPSSEEYETEFSSSFQGNE